eukprot:CAMPEP_0182545320 /NCGR_PEP_ID=MMETSP1323-20130603/34388_1 /TAXON_ID=236787 /ORGANISM="Florenciella parvula, Strain RCC1693" /LENGTH=40 /DNA_ID= /DNA_START= /DNA_END= /DNA_ORIENTATION=
MSRRGSKLLQFPNSAFDLTTPRDEKGNKVKFETPKDDKEG